MFDPRDKLDNMKLVGILLSLAVVNCQVNDPSREQLGCNLDATLLQPQAFADDCGDANLNDVSIFL